MKNVHVFNIVWDTDGEVVPELPEEEVVHVESDDDIADVLSDRFGFCVESFQHEDYYQSELTIVRTNLMEREGYSGYCGNPHCSRSPRTMWNGQIGQFVCPDCGWVSQYPAEFIRRYRAKWNK